MERERKFLVLHPPQDFTQRPHKQIRQGYLATPGRGRDVEVRLRDEQGKYVLTVKGGRGASRSETEVLLSKEGFRSLWPLTKGLRIEKMRYRIPLGHLTIELDIYRGKLRGLKTAEVEFKSDRQLRRFQPPNWFGREVTGRDAFSNSRLATLTRPPANR